MSLWSLISWCICLCWEWSVSRETISQRRKQNKKCNNNAFYNRTWNANNNTQPYTTHHMRTTNAIIANPSYVHSQHNHTQPIICAQPTQPYNPSYAHNMHQLHNHTPLYTHLKWRWTYKNIPCTLCTLDTETLVYPSKHLKSQYNINYFIYLLMYYYYFSD